MAVLPASYGCTLAYWERAGEAPECELLSNTDEFEVSLQSLIQETVVKGAS